MKVVVYLSGGSGIPKMAMCVRDGSTGINLNGYAKHVVDASKIYNSANQPVSIDTFLLNFDKFIYNGVDTLKQNASMPFDNRKIDRLSENTGMSMGRANTSSIFNVL